MHTFDGELAGWSGASGDGFTGLILNGDVNLRLSLGLDGVAYPCICSVNLRRDGDITNIGGRGRIEFDRALDAGIVEKVKVRSIDHHFSYAGNVFFLIIPYRKRGIVNNSVG